MAFRVTGKVSRIYPTSDGAVNIQLFDIPAEDTPQDGYFTLRANHPNFNALYSLALVAAVNRYDLSIRAAGDDIVQGQPASVNYMYVDWSPSSVRSTDASASPPPGGPGPAETLH